MRIVSVMLLARANQGRPLVKRIECANKSLLFLPQHQAVNVTVKT